MIDFESLKKIEAPENLFRHILHKQRNNVLNMTITALANKFELARSSLAGWEGFDKLPKEAILPKIAKVYELNLDQVREAYKISKKARTEFVNRNRKSRRLPTASINPYAQKESGKSGRVSPHSPDYDGEYLG